MLSVTSASVMCKQARIGASVLKRLYWPDSTSPQGLVNIESQDLTQQPAAPHFLQKAG